MTFRRQYEIVVSDPKYSRDSFLVGRFIAEDGTALNNSKVVGIDANTEPASAKVISSPLQMEFTCDYSTDGEGSDPAEATLKLYNLNEQTKRYFNSSPTYVAVKAGYRDTSLPIIYAGQVLSSTTQRDGSDTITTVTLKDSYEAIQRTRIAYKWPVNTPYRSVLQDLAGFFSSSGITVGYIEEPQRKLKVGLNRGITTEVISGDATTEFEDVNVERNDAQTPTSYIVEGYLSDALDEICYALGMTWYVVHNKVYAVNGKRGSEGTFIRAYGIIIEPENVVGLMSIMNDKTTTSSDKTPTGGIKFSTFLDGNISTEKYIEVKDIEGFEGVYKVTSVKHQLNYDGGDWLTKVEATIIG
jgi:hypothetical protein